METISFHIRGEQYNLSLTEFATHLGFYTVEELPERIDRRTPMSDLERTQYWHHLSSMDLYDAMTYKASNIRDPRILILHRIIATSFYRRHESIANVTHGDLEIIHSILSSQFLCPARMHADEFLRMSGKYANQAISGGAFITLLAQGLGVHTDDLEEVGRNIGLTLQTLKNIGVVGVDRYRHFLLAKSGREWVEGGPGDGEDLRVDDFNFTKTPDANSEMLATQPPPGSSHSPLSTYRQSPPRQEYTYHETHGADTSQSSGPYYPHSPFTMISLRVWARLSLIRRSTRITLTAKPRLMISAGGGWRPNRRSSGIMPTNRPSYKTSTGRSPSGNTQTYETTPTSRRLSRTSVGGTLSSSISSCKTTGREARSSGIAMSSSNDSRRRLGLD